MTDRAHQNPHDGPDLETYVETRFNLVMEQIKKTEETIMARMNELNIRYQQRFEDQQMAISKSETATEKRLEGMNEFRKSLADQANMLLPRAEGTALITVLSEKISTIEDRLNLGDGRSKGARERNDDSRASIGMWIAIGVAVLSLLAFLLKIK